MDKPNRWQVLVLVASLLLIVVALFSRTWVIGGDVRAGLWTQEWGDVSFWDDRVGALRTMGKITMFTTAGTCLGLVFLIVFAMIDSRFWTTRLLVFIGVFTQVAAALVFVDAGKAPAGQAFTIFLVGSMGALIGAAAMKVPPPPPLSGAPDAPVADSL